MVEIEKRCKPPFLNPEEVTSGTVFDIRGVEVVPKEETRFRESDRTILTVMNQGTSNRWGLNNTTSDKLVDAFGSNSDDWIGRRLKADKRKQPVAGKDRLVLYGIPVHQHDETLSPKK